MIVIIVISHLANMLVCWANRQLAQALRGAKPVGVVKPLVRERPTPPPPMQIIIHIRERSMMDLELDTSDEEFL